MTTNYADDLFVNISDDGMTEDLWNLAKDDLDKLGGLKASSDKERNLLFYLEMFIDEILKEFNINISEKENVIKAAFEYLRNDENVTLTDIRHAIFWVLRKQKKLAYPNIMGVGQENLQPQYNISKWIQALGQIYAAWNNGENKDVAINRVTEEWDSMEKLNFITWMRYYENNDHEKYQITREAAEMPIIPQPPAEKGEEPEIVPPTRGPGRPRRVRKTLEQSKTSLVSRLDSASRLLREFATVWPPDIWNRLAEALSDLKREIIPLRTIATVTDRIVRTAGVWEQYGFSEGAECLLKIAQDSEDDVATQIEKALTGKEYDTKPKKDEDLEIPPAELPPGTEEMIPPAGVEEEMPAPEVPPAGEVEEIAPPPPVAPPVPEKEVMSVEEDENPFSGKTVQDVLNILEPIAKNLSEREFIHQLSKADMILDSLNIASHFTELAEIQSKALELNLYISTRLKSIISKLQGGLKEEKPEKKESPSVEMEELAPTTPPASPVAPKASEKEMFEVEETPATKTPAVPKGV